MQIPKIYMPYRFYGLSEKTLEKKLLDDIAKYKFIETEKVLAAWRDLLWDSQHFNCKMAELKHFIANRARRTDRTEAVEHLLEKWNEYDHITARISAFDLQSTQVFEDYGFRLMCTHMKYGIDLRNRDVLPKVMRNDVTYEVLQCPCNVPELERIAKEAWSETPVTPDRFHADTHFPKNLADSVYTEWLKNCLSGKLADSVIVPRVEDRIVGFFAFKHVVDTVGGLRVGSLVLAAVDSSVRGKHIYTNMTAVALNSLKSDIVEAIMPVTNYPVQKAYHGLGFKLMSTTYTFHKWMK